MWAENRKIDAGTVDLWEFVRALGQPVFQHADRSHNAELAERLIDWELLVLEDWALYPWTAQAMSWDRQDTVRGIGALQFIAQALGRPYVYQPASIKDAAKAATAETLFDRPLHENRHQNDAVLHAVYWLAQQGSGVEGG